jgi:hypothetical protein
MYILNITSVYACPRLTEEDIVNSIWKEKNIFTLEEKFKDNLNKNIFSNELRSIFEEQKISLSEKVTIDIQTKDNSWIIQDMISHSQYSVRKEHNGFNVYANQMAIVVSKAYPDEEFYGVVSDIEQSADTKTRTREVKVKIPNPSSKLKPGSFVNIKFLIGERKDVPSVSKLGVVTLRNDKYVYVVKNIEEKNGKKLGTAYRVKIETGFEDTNSYELKSSIDEIGWDNFIVVEGQTKFAEKQTQLVEIK